MASVIAMAFSLGCVCQAQFEPGAIILSGDSVEALDKGNGLFFTLSGSERLSDTELRDVAILRGLVLPPDVEVSGSGAGFRRDCLVATETLTWKPGNWKTGPLNLPDRELAIRYDGKAQVAVIGSEAIDCRKGNLVIIHLDSGWHPTTTQLAPSNKAANSLSDFRREFPQDRDLQEAHLYSETHH
jgi:hypothetical protein